MPNDKVIDECPVCHYRDDAPDKYEFLQYDDDRQYGLIELKCPECGVRHTPKGEMEKNEAE